MSKSTVELHGMQRDLDSNSQADYHDHALASHMSILALELRKHYNDVLGDEQTLEEAADMAESATFIASDQDPDLPCYYNDLVLILWDLYYHTGCFETLASAITAPHQAIERLPGNCHERFDNSTTYIICY